MFKHLSVKLLAFILAVIFWFFVVSLENTFYKFPDEIPIQVFNQAQDLALATKLGAVHLSVRASDPVTLRSLSIADFEAYVDLRNMGAGTRKMEVFVTSKNPQVSVIKVEPSEVELTLEPLKEKSVAIKADVIGEPFKGYEVDTVKLSKDKITIAAAESVLAKIGQVKAEVRLDGTEDSKIVKNVTIRIFDAEGVPMEGVKVTEEDPIEAQISIVETEGRREIGVRPKITGALTNGVVKNIQVDPAVVSVTGSRELLDSVQFIETDAIDLKDVTASFEKVIKLNLPVGVKLATGQRGDVRVKVEISQ